MNENKTKEEKLVKKIIPKITEYIKKNEFLKKKISLNLWNLLIYQYWMKIA